MGGPLEVAMQRVHLGGGIGAGGEAGEQRKRSSLRERARGTLSKFLHGAKSPSGESKVSGSSNPSSQAPVLSMNSNDDDFYPGPPPATTPDDDFGPRLGSHYDSNNNSASRPHGFQQQQPPRTSGSQDSLNGNNSGGYENGQNYSAAASEVHSGEYSREWNDYPDEFMCPILKKLMAEPVIVASGISYEKSVIQLYFQVGYRQCYKTGVILESDAVFNNTSLKTAIAHWCDSFGVFRPVPPSAEVARDAVERACREDSSTSGSFVGPDNPSSGGSTSGESHSVILQQIHENGPLNSTNLPGEGGSGPPRRAFEAPPNRVFHPRSHTWSEPHSKHSGDFHESSSSRESCGRLDHLAFVDHQSPSSSSSPVSAMKFSHHTATHCTSPQLGSGSRNADPVEQSSTRSSRPLPLSVTPASFGGSEGKDSVSYSDGRLEDEVVNALVAKLNHKHIKEQEEAVAELRRLSRISPSYRVDLCELHVVEPLLKLLQSRYSQVQINSVAAVMNLSLEKDNKLKVARFGAIPYLVDVLKSGVPEAQEHAAGAIFSLALNDENKMAIGVLGAIPPLIHLLRSNQLGARRDAAMALYHLSFSQMNRSKLIRAGGVGTFLGIVRDERSDVVSRALLILCNIAAMQEGRAALAEKDAVPILVNLLTKGGDDEIVDAAGGQEPKVNWAEVREHAAAGLLLLSQNFRFRTQALQAGALEGLQRLEVEGTPRAREKAAALLANLREPPRGGQDGGFDNQATLYPRRAFNRPGVDVTKAESSVF